MIKSSKFISAKHKTIKSMGMDSKSQYIRNQMISKKAIHPKYLKSKICSLLHMKDFTKII